MNVPPSPSPRISTLPLSLPPRGLSRKQASEYIGVSPSHFDKLVADRIIPPAKRLAGRTVWDLKQLDKAFDALDNDSWHDDSSGGNSWDRTIESKA
jgi:hypothetical protein